MIQVKRIYEPPLKSDGPRLLVDRLWPRGLKKKEAKLEAWLREVAPSTTLRKWFGHDPAKWIEFQRRYRKELDRHPEVWSPILETAKKGSITLLFSARDTQHNSAVVLKAYLDSRLKKSK